MQLSYLALETETDTCGRKITRRVEYRYGVCRKCGCTDFDCSQCIERTGAPCSWVDASHTLCSACK